MELKELTIELCSLAGPSGFETDAAQTAMSLLEPLIDEVFAV